LVDAHNKLFTAHLRSAYYLFAPALSLSAMAAPKISERLREFTQPTGEEELLQVDYPRPRVRISRWQACAIAVIVVVGVIIWLGLSSRNSDESGMPEPAAMGSTTAEFSAEASEIVVSVVGEVAAPGLKTLEPGARVADALAAATPLPEAETMTLNQAQRLADGQQLHILPQGAPPDPALADAPIAAPAGGDKVSLNSATAADLMDLNGVGEVTAEAIVSFREERGGFKDVEELLEVSGIGPAKFAKLKYNVQL